MNSGNSDQANSRYRVSVPLRGLGLLAGWPWQSPCPTVRCINASPGHADRDISRRRRTTWSCAPRSTHGWQCIGRATLL
jgi:hypothetical protein